MARSFNGSSDQILLPTAVPTAAAASFSLWFNPTVTPLSGQYKGIFMRRLTSGTGNGIYYVAYGTSSSPVHLGWYFASNASFVDPGIATLTTGTWYHLAATYDSVNGLQTFVNNVSDGTHAASGTLSTDVTGHPIIGNDTQATRGINGQIADVGLWNTALSAGQITALFNGARPVNVNSANLIGWWPLDGLQSPEPDLSLNANNGTLTGTALAAGPPIMMLTPRTPRVIKSVAIAAAAKARHNLNMPLPW